MKLIESNTFINLAKSYAGECQARTRYEYMEYGARKEGYKALANIIDTVVYNEFNHSRMFYSFIESASADIIDNIDICSGYPFKQKWELIENLKLAVEDEKNEIKLYNEFATTADEEGFTDIANLWRNVASVENCHQMLFKDLYKQFSTGTVYKKKTETKWKCGDCGFEQTGKEAFETCPLCLAKQGSVMLKLSDN